MGQIMCKRRRWQISRPIRGRATRPATAGRGSHHPRPSQATVSERAARGAEGLGLRPVAAALGANLSTVRKWRARFEANGIDGLRRDRPRPGRPSPVSDEQYLAIMSFPAREAYPYPLTHWTVRAAAA